MQSLWLYAGIPKSKIIDLIEQYLERQEEKKKSRDDRGRTYPPWLQAASTPQLPTHTRCSVRSSKAERQQKGPQPGSEAICLLYPIYAMPFSLRPGTSKKPRLL